MVPPVALFALACKPEPPPVDGDPPRVLEGPLVGSSLAAERGALWVGAPGVPDTAAQAGIYRIDVPGSASRLADAGASLVGSVGDLSDAFAPCDDFDGDGVRDVVVGAPDHGDYGGAWWISGPLDGTRAVTEGVWSEGLRVGGHAGAVVSCGDSDGDSVDEVALSAPDTDGGGIAVATGTVDLLRLDAGEVDKIANLDTAWSDSHLGYRTAVDIGHDLDGDGVGDLVVGGYGADRVHLVFGPFAGSYITNSSGPLLQGEEGEGTGHAVAIGDVDGDGSLDLAIGAPAAGNERGAVWLATGPFLPDDADRLLRVSGRRLDGVGPGDQAGFSVAIPGDVDGDGDAELLVGAPFAGGVGPEAGAVYVVRGPGALLGTLDTADGLLLGDVALGRLGWAVAGGDLDGTGRITFAASAPEADTDEGVGIGVVYLFDGAITGVVYPDAAIGRIDR